MSPFICALVTCTKFEFLPATWTGCGRTSISGGFSLLIGFGGVSITILVCFLTVGCVVFTFCGDGSSTCRFYTVQQTTLLQVIQDTLLLQNNSCLAHTIYRTSMFLILQTLNSYMLHTYRAHSYKYKQKYAIF